MKKKMPSTTTQVKTIGILGGMGPEATLLFYEKIIKFTKAKKDQEHIPTFIYSNTKIPDRTSCILKGKHQKIIKELQTSAKVLENSGASLITIPCNTSHYYLKEIKASVKIPVLDMISETAQHINKNYKKERKIGLLATSGTLQTKIYQKEFKPLGITLVIPGEKDQRKVMRAIYNVKASGFSEESKILLEKVIKNFRERYGIKLIVLGCTELPLLFREEKHPMIIDPMDILARTAIERAGGELR